MTAPTRDQILDAAARLYGEHGFRGTTTRRIAQEAGVNEVTLFRLFGSKTALLLEALRVHGVEPIRTELPTVPTDPLAELTAWCTHKRRAISNMRSIIRKAMSEFEENPEMPKCITQGASLTYASLREYLQRLSTAGFTSGKADAPAAASMLISTVFHDAIARDMMPQAFPQPSSAAPGLYARLCLKSLGFDAAAQKGRRNGRRRALLAGLILTMCAGAAAPLRAQQGASSPPPAGAAVTAISLDDALRLGSRVSHTVKTAEAGVLRARGGQYQARSQYLPQVNGSLAYQRLLQSQFAAIAGSAPADTTSKSGSGGSSERRHIQQSPVAREDLCGAEHDDPRGDALAEPVHGGTRERRKRRRGGCAYLCGHRTRCGARTGLTRCRAGLLQRRREREARRDRGQHARADGAHAAADDRVAAGGLGGGVRPPSRAGSRATTSARW